MLAFYAKQAMGHVVGPERRAEEVERLGSALVRSMARNGRDGTTAGCSREGRLQRIWFPVILAAHDHTASIENIRWLRIVQSWMGSFNPATKQ